MSAREKKSLFQGGHDSHQRHREHRSRDGKKGGKNEFSIAKRVTKIDSSLHRAEVRSIEEVTERVARRNRLSRNFPRLRNKPY